MTPSPVEARSTVEAPSVTEEDRASAPEVIPLIEVRDLCKSFGPRAALSNVDLDIFAGQLLALLGPNGAGKTTLLRILATLSKPTSGSIRYEGVDMTREGTTLRRRIGLLSHQSLLYEDLTAHQNLAFYAIMYDLAEPEERISEMLRRVGLEDRREDLVRTFSRGMQQRLALARALLHRPSVLLLDEPYSGLDPRVTAMLSDLLAELREEGCTIVMTTHDLPQGLALGRRIVVLRRGRIVYDAPRDQVDERDFPRLYDELTD